MKHIANPFIIAELSANHNQKLDIALQSVEAIAKSGADALKVQTYTPSCLTLPCHNDYFKIKSGLWQDKYLWDLYEDAQMPWEWHEEIFTLANSLGLVAFSSPFSVRGMEFLERLNCPIYKVASFEIAHIPLLESIAATKKPVILSLGIANDSEIEKALEILKDNESRTLLYCISAYPADIKDAKLSNIQGIMEKWGRFDIKVGISDHTLGISVPIAAVMCGAEVIEKHFILDRALGGVDSEFSLNADEFTLLAKSAKEAYLLKQDVDKKPYSNSEKKKGREFARSLFVSKDVKKGEVISMDNIACVRPSFGLSPLLLDSIIGLQFSKDIAAGMPLSKDDIESK